MKKNPTNQMPFESWTTLPGPLYPDHCLECLELVEEKYGCVKHSRCVDCVAASLRQKSGRRLGLPEIVWKLQEDHHQLVKIFDLIERELQTIEDGGEPEIRLLLNVLEYIRYYPDVFHRPLEDYLFDRLIRWGEMRSIVEKLRVEHLKLAEMTNAFRDAVSHMQETPNSADRDQASTLGREYIEAQRSHMATEDTIAFPQAVNLLTEHEWDQVREYAAETSPVADPVFGPSVKARYQELRERIEHHI